MKHKDELVITVFLADDHAIVRDGLRLILSRSQKVLSTFSPGGILWQKLSATYLEAQPGIKVVGEATGGRETVHLVAQLRPDIVLLDIAMPGLNGVEAARRIGQSCPFTQVIILSMHSTTEHIFQAMQAGAHGYLLKEATGLEVVNAIRAVYAGNRYLSQKISNELVDDYVLRRQAAEAKSPLAQLSSREREVLQLVVEGKSNAEIAGILSLSLKTIQTYRCRLMRKLGISNLPALVKFAIQHGLTPLA